jgi:hypothetical protein
MPNNSFEMDFCYAAAPQKPLKQAFPAASPPGIAVLTASSTLPRRCAPEQGTGPDTAHRSIKLRLLDRRTAPVSTAIVP